MLFTILAVVFYAHVHADNLAPSAAQSMQFQEAPAGGRGPASINPIPEAPQFQEVDDRETEAGFCYECAGRGEMKSSSPSHQGAELLKHAKKAAGTQQ